MARYYNMDCMQVCVRSPPFLVLHQYNVACVQEKTWQMNLQDLFCAGSRERKTTLNLQIKGCTGRGIPSRKGFTPYVI